MAFQRSVNRFTAALSADPEYMQALVYRGEAHIALKEYEAAGRDLLRATHIDDDSFLAWNDLAVSYWWRGQYGNALEAVERAAEQEPDDPTIVFNLLEGTAAVSGRQDPEYGMRLQAYRRVLRDTGRDAAAYLQLDVDDVWKSAAKPAIAERMDGLCTDLLETASLLNVHLDRTCRRDTEAASVSARS